MPFQKGNAVSVGNRGPDVKRLCASQLIAELHDAARSGKDKGVTRLRKIVKKMCSLAEQGDKEMIMYIFDRVDGKMAQPIGVPDLGGQSGPMEFTLRIGTRDAEGAEEVMELNATATKKREIAE